MRSWFTRFGKRYVWHFMSECRYYKQGYAGISERHTQATRPKTGTLCDRCQYLEKN